MFTLGKRGKNILPEGDLFSFFFLLSESVEKRVYPAQEENSPARNRFMRIHLSVINVPSH